jgi:hypothetical protein
MAKTLTNEYIKKGDYYELHIDGSIHGNKIIKIDNDDVEKIKKHHWCIIKCCRCNKVYYYIISDGLLIQRFIMNIINKDRNIVVDHKNGDTLDNRKNNLKVCSQKENVRKSELSLNNTSGHVGVCWYKNTGQWMAKIQVDYKQITLGYFDNIEDAVKAREKAEITYFGEYTPLKKID